jgi:hypothetical protein
MNDKTIPHFQTAKYLGMTLDAKLRWKLHIKKKREELGLKYKRMYWLMGRRPCQNIASWCSTDTEAIVDLRHPVMGMHETEQHRHNTEISKQSTQKYS